MLGNESIERLNLDAVLLNLVVFRAESWDCFGVIVSVSVGE